MALTICKIVLYRCFMHFMEKYSFFSQFGLQKKPYLFR